jgi:hypothetical protein
VKLHTLLAIVFTPFIYRPFDVLIISDLPGFKVE